MSYLDSVVLFDVGVGEADGSSVVGDNVGDLVLAKALSLDLAKLETGLFGVDLHRLEATLDVVQDSVALASLGNGHHVHQSEGESRVSSYFIVNFDVGISRSADLEGFLAVEGKSEAVSEEHGQGNALSQLVGTGRGTRSVKSLQLVQAPVGRRPHALHMFLKSASLSKNTPQTIQLLTSVRIRSASLYIYLQSNTNNSL